MPAFRRLAAAAAVLALAACAGAPPVDSAPPSAAAEGRLVLMGTTDLHGWILPYDYYTGERTNNGLAALVPLIDSVRAANPERTVLVESGEVRGSTRASRLRSRRPLTIGAAGTDLETFPC